MDPLPLAVGRTFMLTETLIAHSVSDSRPAPSTEEVSHASHHCGSDGSDGVLTVALQKTDDATSRKIKVKA